jgi:signal transduction histidine kinase
MDVFASSDGLSGDFVLTLFEDREGNIWAGTLNGLDRFHDLAVPTFSVRQGLSNALVGSVLAARDGSVWFGTFSGLNVWKGGQITIPRTGSAQRDGKLNGLDPNSLYQDPRGRVWVSTRDGVGYLENDLFVSVSGVPGGNVWAFAEDAAGNLWIDNLTVGLLRLSPHGDVQQIPWPALGRQDPATALVADRSQRGLWIGFDHGGVAYFAGDQVRKWYGAADGLGEGRVTGLHLDSDGTVWAATEGGLSRLKNGRIATLSSKNGLPCDAVHWMIEDDAHAIWLYMACGLVRTARTEIDACTDAADKGEETKRTVQTAVFDTSDGVRTHTSAGGYGPLVSKAGDGRLWFTSWDGVSVVDPRHLPFNKLPPPVHVEQITADHKSFDAPSAVNEPLRLPPLVRDLQIDYTALSLVAPEKVRFRYKLEGWDRDWQDAGNRRQAFYNYLPPRDYRFRVIACNNSGVWNETGASLDFAVAPAYYQTGWFRVAAVVAFLGLLAALYQLRLHQVARDLRARMEARVEERERIARDLHDTLLQSLQGVILKFDAVAKRIPSEEPIRRAIDETLDRADQVLAEGRDRVRNLRGAAEALSDLAAALERVAKEISPGGETTFKSVVEGRPRELHPMVLEETYSIGREALLNALTHSGGRCVEMELTYDPRQFRLRIRDDGRGIEPEIIEAGGRVDHWGLPGMRERARKIGAQLDLWSRPGAGTEVELKVPAATAYRGLRPTAWKQWFRRSAGMS